MKVVCPKCGSDQITANKKGFSTGKAVAGAVLTGGIGLLAGNFGSKKVICTCLACGKQFKAGEGRIIYEPGDKTKEEVERESLMEIKKRNAEIKKTPAFKILRAIALIFLGILIIGIIVAQFSESPKTQIKGEVSKPDDYFEIKDQYGMGNYSIYIKNKDSASIARINEYLKQKYDPGHDKFTWFDYFDNEEVAFMFHMYDWNNISEKNQDTIFKHYVAQYWYNPTNKIEGFEMVDNTALSPKNRTKKKHKK